MTRRVDCPGCGRATAYSPENPWRPFCSARCKTGDLGAWASDAYVIQGPSPEDIVPDGEAGGPRADDC